MQESVSPGKAYQRLAAPRAIVVGDISSAVVAWLKEHDCTVTVEPSTGLTIIELPSPDDRAIIENGSHWWEFAVSFSDEFGAETGIVDVEWDLDAYKVVVSLRA